MRRSITVNSDDTGTPSFDLEPSSIDTTNITIDPQTLTMTGSVNIQIHNNGNTAVANAFELTVFEDSNANQIFNAGVDQILGTKTVTNRPAGNSSISETVAINGNVLFEQNLIYAYVDSSNAIEESDESNNINHNMASCEYHPPVGEFNPALEWEWTGSEILPEWNQVMSGPVVANLNDDNGDGKVDSTDTPDIIFLSYKDKRYWTNGVLRAISGDGQQEHFTVTDYRTIPESNIALGDVDNDGLVEIFAVETAAADGSIRILAFENDGGFKWASGTFIIKQSSPEYDIPILSVADIDHDGNPEILMGNVVLNHDGSTKWVGQGSTGKNASIAIDLDLNGTLEVLAGNTVYNSDGSIYWHNDQIADGYTAVADFDQDSYAEIVLVTPEKLYLLEHTGQVIWGPVTIPGGNRGNAGPGGPPTIADFDNDGNLEIGISSYLAYSVFEADGSVNWETVTFDRSSVTGSSVFDFDGDGSVEVIYADETHLRIYRGLDGETLFESTLGSGTILEIPLVVDVDNDNNAEIVVVSNNHNNDSNNGIQIFGDANDTWVNTRKIWNQHAYSITNVNDDGTIPQYQARNWETFNNFRQNELINPFGCNDLTASQVRVNSHAETTDILARIGNGGALHVAAGTSVSFYDADPDKEGQLLGTVQVDRQLNPGDFEDVQLTLNNLLVDNQYIYSVVDDDGTGRGKVSEINEDNNKAFTFYSKETQACVTPPPSMISWWPGDGNAMDIQGNNHGTLQNGASFAPGMVDQAFSFDGVDDQVLVPNSSDLNFDPLAPITVDAWVFSTKPGVMHILGKRLDCSNEINFQLATDANALLSFGAGAGTGVGAGVAIPLDTWTHVAGTFDGVTWRIYLNGLLVKANINGTLGQSTNADFTIGTSGSCPHFGGLIDEVEIFNRALSAAEIQALFNAGQAGKCKTPPGNNIPVITSSPITTLIESQLYSYDVEAIDADNDILIYSLIEAPEGMTIDPNTGLIEWMPTNDQTGRHSVSVKASDTKGLFDTQDFSVDFNVGEPQLCSVIPVGGYPNRMEISPSGNILYVLDNPSDITNDVNGRGSIRIVDTINEVEIGEIPLDIGFPADVVFSSDGKRAYVTVSKFMAGTLSNGVNRVDVIDTENRTVIATIPTGGTGASRIVISSDDNRVYLTDRRDDKVRVIDTKTNTLLASIPVSGEPSGIIIASDDSQIYVSSRRENKVTIIDTSTYEIVGSFPVSLLPTGSTSIVIDSATLLGYITSSLNSEIVVIDLDQNSPTFSQQVDTIQTAATGLVDLDISIVKKQLIVSNSAVNEVLLIDIDINSANYHKQVETIAVGSMPVGVVFQGLPLTIGYVANRTDATVQALCYADSANEPPKITSIPAPTISIDLRI